MNKKLYDKRLAWDPSDFEGHIIPDANHAQYGDCGKQPRDNDAAISAEKQQSQTAEIILDWLNRHFSEVKANEQQAENDKEYDPRKLYLVACPR